jgi:hypothetical protein
MIQTIIARFEAIGSERALTPEESAQLERAVRRQQREAGRVYFVWLPKHPASSPCSRRGSASPSAPSGGRSRG